MWIIFIESEDPGFSIFKLSFGIIEEEGNVEFEVRFRV